MHKFISNVSYGALFVFYILPSFGTEGSLFPPSGHSTCRPFSLFKPAVLFALSREAKGRVFLDPFGGHTHGYFGPNSLIFFYFVFIFYVLVAQTVYANKILEWMKY